MTQVNQAVAIHVRDARSVEMRAQDAQHGRAQMGRVGSSRAPKPEMLGSRIGVQTQASDARDSGARFREITGNDQNRHRCNRPGGCR